MIRHPAFFWIGAFGLAIGFVWLFQDMLLPFVLGIVIAYLLDPAVDWLSARGVGRRWAVIGILGLFLLLIGVFVALAGPILYRQFVQLMQDLPGYLDEAWSAAQSFVDQTLGPTQGNRTDGIRSLLGANVGSATAIARNVVEGVVEGGMVVFQIFTVLVVTPVVAYGVLHAWPQIMAGIQDLLPRPHRETIVALVREMDRRIAGFVRGQIIVAAVLGLLYATALTLAGLKYGLLIGLGAGALSVIPLVGSITGFVTSVGVAWFQSQEPSYVGLIGAIFLAGQVLEGNLLTPKLVGDQVGLNYLWVFFALLAGASLAGILGMLLAVPVAAVASVLIGFAIERYKDSALYRGSPSA